MFAPGGSVLPCDNRSKLIHNLENLIQTQDETHQNVQTPASEEQNEIFKIANVDGMDLVLQMTEKRNTPSTVKDLSRQFRENLLMLTADFNEVYLVFDTYKTESPKQETRQKRQHGKDPIHYEIADDTRINLTPMAYFLSPEKQRPISLITLLRLYLKLNANSQKLFIISALGCTKSDHDIQFVKKTTTRRLIL